MHVGILLRISICRYTGVHLQACVYIYTHIYTHVCTYVYARADGAELRTFRPTRKTPLRFAVEAQSGPPKEAANLYEAFLRVEGSRAEGLRLRGLGF